MKYVVNVEYDEAFEVQLELEAIGVAFGHPCSRRASEIMTEQERLENILERVSEDEDFIGENEHLWRETYTLSDGREIGKQGACKYLLDSSGIVLTPGFHEIEAHGGGRYTATLGSLIYDIQIEEFRERNNGHGR